MQAKSKTIMKHLLFAFVWLENCAIFAHIIAEFNFTAK